MKRLLDYLRKNLKETILAPLFKMLEASFELFVPLVVANMIDIGVAGRDQGYLIRMGCLMVILGIVGFISSATAQYFAAKSAVSAGTAMRNDLFAHMGTFTYQEIDQIGTSTLITRMTSDINQVQNGVNMFLRLFLRSPFVVLGAVVMAFAVDRRTAVVFAVTIPVLFVVVFLILLVSMPLYQRVQKQLDDVLQKTRENLLGIRVIRAFNRQKSEMREFDKSSRRLYRRQIFVGKISALLNPVTYVVVNLGIIGVLWAGGRQVNAGRLTQGEVIALINYMSQILAELIKLANLMILLSRAAASLSRVEQVFQTEGSITDGTGELAGKGAAGVTFDHVSYSYAGAKQPAVQDVTFCAAPGDTIGIIGGTGSGKTTLVNLIPRFYEVQEGEIRFQGQNIKNLKMEHLRENIGFVPQKAALFRGTLRDNMRWGKKDASDEEIYEALKTAQALDFVEQKGEDLDFMIQQNGRNLSGGQKQRLTIARALVRKPSVLILDDSASALDFATDARLRKEIARRTDQMTVFIVSQRVSAVKNADQILVMDNGRVSGKGTHRDLLNSCHIYREICESQMTREEVEADAQ